MTARAPCGANKRCKEFFKDKTTNKIAEVKDEETGAEETEGRRPRHHSPDRNKNYSKNDAKALKPEMLETSLPPL